MLPQAHISHHIVGRTRIRVPERRGDSAYFALLHGTFAQMDGVSTVSVNHRTGSLLVEHSRELPDLVAVATEQRLFALDSLRPRDLPLAKRMADHLDAIDSELSRISAGSLDTPSLAMLILLGMGIYQISAGKIAAPAATLLWYALNSLGFPPGGKR